MTHSSGRPQPSIATATLEARRIDHLPPKVPAGHPLRALDLFCGAGGATRGLQLAGFKVLGVDVKRSPRYVGDWFIEADALSLTPEFLRRFDFVWASPPCQAYIRGGTVAKDRHPRLIEPTRELLALSGADYVIENVPGAPIRADLMLCGSMFGLGVRRHRWFEASWRLEPFTFACNHSKPITGVYGNAHGKRGAWRGMLPSNLETWSREMAIDWMKPAELTAAIPPAYSEFIARAWLAQRNNKTSHGGPFGISEPMDLSHANRHYPLPHERPLHPGGAGAD